MNISRPGRLIFATLSLTLASSPALAQEPGIRGVLSIDQRLDYSDNPEFLASPGDGKYTSTTSLNFGLNSETRSEQFSLNFGGAFVGAFGDDTTSEDDLDFGNETASISYAREGANSRLTLGGSFRRFDLDDDVFGFFVDGVFDPEALIIDGGQRTSTNFNGSFETGIDGPFGFELRASVSERDYEGTTDPELVDNTRKALDGIARFRINPTFTARLLAGISQADEADATDTERRNTYVGVGVEGETGGGLSYTGDVTLDQSERTELGSVVSDEDGVGISLSATQDQPDGSIGVSLSSRLDDSGRRTTASLSRNFDLPDGALSLSLGVVDQEDEDLELTTTLAYTREFSDGAFSANIVQQPTTDDGTAFLNTSIALNYRQDINPISSWDAGFSYGASSRFGSSGSDTRTSASVSYNRELTEDWGMRAGVTLTRIDEDGGSDRTRNTVFFSVGRDFTFGF